MRMRVPRTYAGPKKGKPMMWSQCTCDMKMFTAAGLPPWRARTCSPKARAPLPMSQTKYSSCPVSNSTQEVWPPKVWLTANGSVCCANAYACAWESKRRPEAAISACASLSRMSAAVSATGIEPRVPQKRTRMARSAPVEGLHCLRRDRGERLARRGEHRQHQIEAADLQDLGDHRLRRGDHDAARARRGLLGGDHQAAQAGARHVLEPRHVEHQRRAFLHAGVELRRQVGLEAFAVVVIEPAAQRDHARGAVAPVAERHEIF